MLTARRLVDRLVDLATFIGGLGLVFVTGIILIDVTGRAFGAPLTGAQDLSQMALVIVVFGGMAYCDRIGGHVAVDVFAPAFGMRFNRLLDIVALLLGTAIFAGIAWTVWQSAALSQMLHLSTNILQLPKAKFQWALAAFALLTSLAMFLRALSLAFTGDDGRTANREDVL